MIARVVPGPAAAAAFMAREAASPGWPAAGPDGVAAARGTGRRLTPGCPVRQVSRRARRGASLGFHSRKAPAATPSAPAATRPAQGAGEEPGTGAVPPIPVAAPPRGMTALPAASSRSASFRPVDPSSTTRV
jgi:hypothetical protein